MLLTRYRDAQRDGHGVRRSQNTRALSLAYQALGLLHVKMSESAPKSTSASL